MLVEHDLIISKFIIPVYTDSLGAFQLQVLWVFARTKAMSAWAQGDWRALESTPFWNSLKLTVEGN